MYPAGATTNSESGVTDIRNCYDTLAVMAQVGMPLLVHGEVTHDEIDIFDREAVFIQQVMTPLTQELPDLRVVFEHITTADAVAFVRSAPANIAATITAHHLLLNRNDMLVGGCGPTTSAYPC